MSDYLVQKFIKNSENYQLAEVRESYGILTSVVGAICNVLLFVVKIFIGMVIGSISVMADAFNNLSDAISSVVSFVGAKLSNRPADDEHPFGHGRYEYIAALVVAFLVLEVGFTCLKSSVDKIQNPQDISFSPVLVAILLLSVGVKLWLGLFNRKLGKKINSSVMRATSTDAFGDMLITMVTVISILVSHFTGLQVDGYMGLIVSLFVLYAGVGIIRETLVPLIGEAVSSETYDKITSFVEQFDGILGSHDLIVHSYGPTQKMATIHAEVAKDENLETIHEVIDHIEREAQKNLGIMLVIHMDPIETDDENVLRLKTMVRNVLKEIDQKISFHDFRVVNGEEQINLIFDLVIPHAYKGDMRLKLLNEVTERISQQDSRCQCVMTVEHSYVKDKQKK